MIARALFILVLVWSAAAAASDPIKSYTTWNPADKSSCLALSNGNLSGDTDGGVCGARSVQGKSAGKWYVEFPIDNANNANSVVYLGVSSAASGLTQLFEATGWGFDSLGRKLHSGVTASGLGTYLSGYVVGMAVDLDAGKVWWSINGTWIGSGNPGAGSNPAFSGLTGTLFLAGSGSGSGGGFPGWSLNAGASSFVYTPPTGFRSGWYEVSCAAEDETLSEDETECTTPVPPDGSGFAVAGMGAGLAGLAAALVGVIWFFVGVGGAVGFIKGYQS